MTRNSFKIWFEYELGIRKELTKEEKQEIEACKFAMHLLIPTESVNRYIEKIGGLEEVKNDQLKIQYLAKIYGVPIEIMLLKINYLTKKDKKKKKHEKTK